MERQSEKKVMTVEQIFNEYIQSQVRLCEVITELFKRTERSETFVNGIKRLRDQ